MALQQKEMLAMVNEWLASTTPDGKEAISFGIRNYSFVEEAPTLEIEQAFADRRNLAKATEYRVVSVTQTNPNAEKEVFWNVVLSDDKNGTIGTHFMPAQDRPMDEIVGRYVKATRVAAGEKLPIQNAFGETYDKFCRVPKSDQFVLLGPFMTADQASKEAAGLTAAERELSDADNAREVAKIKAKAANSRKLNEKIASGEFTGADVLSFEEYAAAEGFAPVNAGAKREASVGGE